MVKYGKEFRQNQKSEWKEKYFNYKAQKQIIKKHIEQRREIELIGDIDLDEKIKQLAFVFEEGLSKEMKRVFIFFANKEKTLYKKINECLHYKDEYEQFGLNDFERHYEELKQLSELSLDMSNFVFYNLKALIKILKKYDKKVITNKKKDIWIKQIYIQEKIEEQNSDILYLLKFKMIDEVNVILEDLIKCLMKQFKSDKDRLIEDEQNGEEEEGEGDEKLIKNGKSTNETINNIKKKHEQIKQNIQKIDTVSGQCTKLFLPWKGFLRISGDINSKFIQISRESSSINDSVSSGFMRNQSIIDSIIISRDSKYNIFIVLFHGFLYMFSLSVIIPSYISIIEKTIGGKRDYEYIFWGILMVMAPIGTLFNYLYETCLFKRSTKKPIIFSCLALIIGNISYVLAPKFHYVSLLFIGRLVCGLFNLRTHNKMYIINFLLKKDVSFYLTMFHTASIFGLALGFGLNSAFLFINSDNDIFNKDTIGSIITCALSLILLIIACITFTEAHSKKFSITSMQMFGDGISESMSEGNDDGEKVARTVRSKTLALKDIDDKLGNFNRQSNFDDTNLVTKSINELASKEEGGLHSLLNVYIVYLIIIITTKFINESLFINSNIFMIQVIGKKSKYDYIIPLVLGGSYFMILLVELSLSCKSRYIAERTLIIILLVLLLINNGLFFIFYLLGLSNYYYIMPTDIIITNITEKYVAHLFLYIIPDSYKICKINGNVFINIFSMISRIVCCAMLIIINIKDVIIYNLIIFCFMTGLSLISLLLYLIYYKEIRIKAINRIMKNIPKDDIKIATEL